eukprot:CAMPEP_0204357058 /NCGR_PEP_ID=MMETSP0469-20131031/35434_1 /ASSEMBLY_ACC=CAM_ASM_000384 /TAXON_ID=2969 /ORGANISM="Oxyrrhis marina" /LENGTH=38 /DNA_ID= /DNA_START= /DNA_END= /DNA_ORIENTATION=
MRKHENRWVDGPPRRPAAARELRRQWYPLQWRTTLRGV